MGLDHISFCVASRADLDRATALFHERGLSHGEIKDRGAGLGAYLLAFRDRDNIQPELTAPYG